jgi:hypothetical protein
MNKFTTVNELVGHTKQKINDLHSIVDVLLQEYRDVSNVIHEQDLRKKPLEQLQELNEIISDIVDTHPALCESQISWNNIDKLLEIVASEQTIASVSRVENKED